MQLVLEVCDTTSGEPPASKNFDRVGGVIGRGMGCDWVLPDATRLISSHHGLISYREGCYFLTDISSNGIGVSGSLERLRKGQARLISEGDVYQLGSMDIRVRLLGNGRPPSASSEAIPDDAFLGLDPVQVMDCGQLRSESSQAPEGLDTLTESVTQSLYQGAVDRDHLVAPAWAEPAIDAVSPSFDRAAPADPEAFWLQFGETLGVSVDALDTAGREALAIKAAGLLRHAMEGLQQSLRTRDELNSEMSLGWCTPVLKIQNPLLGCADSQAALTSLLGPGEPGQLSAERAVAQVFQDLQVHQLALVVACRTALRSALAAFAPGHLLLCFEREGKPPRFSTDGVHWRAYQRHYRQMTDDNALGEQWLRTDFSRAYEEQVRLVSTGIRTTVPHTDKTED